MMKDDEPFSNMFLSSIWAQFNLILHDLINHWVYDITADHKTTKIPSSLPI